jgi:hypothetical protein
MEMLVISFIEKLLLRNTKFLFVSVLDTGQVSSISLIPDLQTGLAEDGGKWKWEY